MAQEHCDEQRTSLTPAAVDLRLGDIAVPDVRRQLPESVGLSAVEVKPLSSIAGVRTAFDGIHRNRVINTLERDPATYLDLRIRERECEPALSEYPLEVALDFHPALNRRMVRRHQDPIIGPDRENAGDVGPVHRMQQSRRRPSYGADVGVERF